MFCGTRVEVDALTEVMNGRGYRAEALHGGMDQDQRDRVMDRLRSGTADLLVATDVAARGLDIDHLTHVINHDVPAAAETYTHRIGRVGRAGRTGVAASGLALITMVDPEMESSAATELGAAVVVSTPVVLGGIAITSLAATGVLSLVTTIAILAGITVTAGLVQWRIVRYLTAAAAT